MLSETRLPIPASHPVRGLLASILLLFAISAARATSPHLEAITPAGAQRGMEVQVTFTGDRLQDAEEVFCYEPGIQVSKPDLITNKVVKTQFKIAPDCELGEHHLRLDNFVEIGRAHV